MKALNSSVAPDKTQISNEEAAAPLNTYIVVQGDTLWKIAKKFYGNGNKYKQIMTANGLKNTMIKVGLVLTIPAG